MKPSLFVLIFSSVILIALSQSGFAEISVTAEVDKAFITIGEHFEYRVMIRHDPEVKVSSAIEARHLGDFRVKSVENLGPYEEGGMIVEGRAFRLTAYALGEYVIEPIEVAYDDENKQRNTMATSTLYVTVRSVDPSRPVDADIRGLKGVKVIGGLNKAFLLGGVIMMTLIVASSLALWKLKKKATTVAEPDAELGPLDKALHELDALYHSGLLREGKTKEYYSGLADIVRGYLERKLNFPSWEITTHEIEASLRDRDCDKEARSGLVELLEQCDLVKFAKHRPTDTAFASIRRLTEIVLKQFDASMSQRSAESRVTVHDHSKDAAGYA